MKAHNAKNVVTKNKNNVAANIAKTDKAIIAEIDAVSNRTNIAEINKATDEADIKKDNAVMNKTNITEIIAARDEARIAPKAVVVDLKADIAVLLSDDGRVTKHKNRNYAIGQVIELGKQKSIHIGRRAIALAASAAAAVIMLSMGAWAYYTPYTYVSLDVNPSIEYSVNRFNRVLSAKAVNDDGKEILSGLNLQNTSIDDAINATIEKIASKGYLKSGEQGGIVIATSSGDKQAGANLAKELQTRAENTVKGLNVSADVQVQNVATERVQEARQLGTTPGKLNLVEKLQQSASDPISVDIKEWLSKPVKDIMKTIKANKKANPNAKSDDPTDTDSSDTSSATSSAVSSDGTSSQVPSDSSTVPGDTSSVLSYYAESQTQYSILARNSTSSSSASSAKSNDDSKSNNGNGQGSQKSSNGNSKKNNK